MSQPQQQIDSYVRHLREEWDPLEAYLTCVEASNTQHRSRID